MDTGYGLEKSGIRLALGRPIPCRTPLDSPHQTRRSAGSATPRAVATVSISAAVAGGFSPRGSGGKPRQPILDPVPRPFYGSVGIHAAIKAGRPWPVFIAWPSPDHIRNPRVDRLDRQQEASHIGHDRALPRRPSCRRLAYWICRTSPGGAASHISCRITPEASPVSRHGTCVTLTSHLMPDMILRGRRGNLHGPRHERASRHGRTAGDGLPRPRSDRIAASPDASKRPNSPVSRLSRHNGGVRQNREPCRRTPILLFSIRRLLPRAALRRRCEP